MDDTQPPHLLDDDDAALLERVRAYVEGELDPDAAAALEAEARERAEIGEWLTAYREVHRLTSVAEPAPPPCRVEFADIERRIAADEPRPLWRLGWLRAAAALLLVSVSALAAWRLTRPVEPRPVEPRTVHLGALASAAVAPAPDDVPGAALEEVAATLSDFAPVRSGQPNWLDSYDEGVTLARATGRPLLLFIYHETCPMCLDMREKAFVDDDVLAALDDFVPVQVDVMTGPKSVTQYTAAGWPFLGAFDGEGTELAVFPGWLSPEQFLQSLIAARKESEATPVPWTHARALAARLDTARLAAESGDLGRAHREFTALTRDDRDGAFGRAGSRGVAAIAAAASEILDSATVATTPSAASAILQDGTQRLGGTPYAAVLTEVRNALEETGLFPRLVPPQVEGQPVGGGDRKSVGEPGRRE